MSINQQSKPHCTSDLPYAAILVLMGFPIEEIDRSNPRRAIFQFKDSDKLQKIQREYHNGSLQVEPRHFFDALKTLKTRLYA